VTLRVLVATDSLGQGGAERQLALTVKNLPKCWEVRCFSAGGGPFAEELLESGIDLQVVERRFRFDPVPFLQLWRLLKQWRPDLVHSWGYMTTLAGSPAYVALGIPYVDATVQTGDVRLVRKWRCNAGFNRASLVVGNTRCGLDSACVPPERGRVIHNGFDFSRIPAVTPPRQDERFTVVMAARMHPAKDYRSFLSAARILAEDLGPAAVRFVALGDGPDRAVLQDTGRDMIDSGLLEFRVVLDVVPELLVSDCGVLMTSPDRVEGISNSILEYMACGLPVICSGGGGTDELVACGETGFLVSPGDAQELATRLRWVCQHPDAARAMGLKAAEMVRREYSVEAMIRRTERVYLEALAQRGRSRL